MDLNKTIKTSKWNGHSQFPEIIKYAVKLYKQGNGIDHIMKELDIHFTEEEKYEMKKNTVPSKVYGNLGVDIEMEAYNQLMTASKLPVATQSALMPDGHVGYALPIGGVIGIENAVSPHFVGFDIACRMTVSILNITPEELKSNRDQLAKFLNNVTSFGLNANHQKFWNKKRCDHKVMEDSLWNEISHLKNLKDKAYSQLGSSGGGNHFCNLMIGTVIKENNHLPKHLNVGDEFVALVTHSGSRGVGHKMATYYSQRAKDWIENYGKDIPKGYEWLPIDNALGEEYWKVMNLMGDYAQANHHLIHKRFSKKSKIQSLFMGENHHNFAWHEVIDGKDIYIHRKGATPAHNREFGIIPGSMGTNSYLVEGLGESNSLNSSSHGAGRISSRTEAKKNHKENEYKKHVAKHDILTIGVNQDETYQAYKNIESVMEYQEGILVNSIAKMFPSVVIMGGKSDDGD